MIRLEAASATVPGRDAPGSEPRVVLRDLEGSFQAGEIHRILGANGSGKTTLIRLLAGLRAPASGRVLFDGNPLRRGGSRTTLWPRVAVLFEEPDPQFLTESVEAEIAFGLESLALPPEEIRARTGEAMRSFGLSGFERRHPHTLSGGEKVRVLLAAAHAARPGALVLDQSLSHLDPASRRDMLGTLSSRAALEARLLIHAQQIWEPPHPTERVHRIQDGRLVSVMPGSGDGKLERTWGDPRDGVGPCSAPAGTTGDVVIALDRVSWRPPGHAHRGFVVRGITLEARRGEIVALVGRSGAGKSTLLKLAAGLIEPSSGTARRPARANGHARAVGLALEYPERQLFGRTVGEDVAAILWVDGVAEGERRARSRVALESVGLDPGRFEGRAPGTLSEGEKRRAALAGLLVEPPRALLLDEPTAGLDLEGRRALARVLLGCRDRGQAVILASHDLELVSRVAGRVVVLAADGEGCGTVAGEGSPDEVWSSRTLLARAGLEPATLRHASSAPSAEGAPGSVVADRGA